MAGAGDEILVAPGVYREAVDPPRGGTDEHHRILYRSEVRGKAVISGAEPVKDWAKYQADVWVARIHNSVFGDYNPYTTYVRGDWYFAPSPVHTGEVYLNGKAMYEEDALEKILHPQVRENSWDPEASVYQWYTCQEEIGRAHV